MKTKTTFFAILITLVIASCKKDTPTPSSSAATTYSSMQDFYNTNGVQKQIYTIDASTGGMFISPKGTKVTIPANAFVTQSGGPVTGTVTIEFKDIYSKSDMLLSNVPSMTNTGAPLKSAGEFYIRAISEGNGLILNPGKIILTELPFSGSADPDMTGYSGSLDSITGQITWEADSAVSVVPDFTAYLCSLSEISTYGSWINLDAPHFTGYPSMNLLVNATQNRYEYYTNAFLIFPNDNSVVYLSYESGSPINQLHYEYAPDAMQCTLVAVGFKNGKLYSTFLPFTITSGQEVNFTLTETTDVAFKAQLNALN